MSDNVVVAVDASRNRSGGARAHLLGILSAYDPRCCGVSMVHVWSYDDLLDQLPNLPWLVKHKVKDLNRSLFSQIWWQYRKLPIEISTAGCNVLLSTSAGTLCNYKPDVVMSRDMLSFEGREMSRYSYFSFAYIRLLLLKWIQVRSLQKATGVIFLTEYAANVIQTFTGNLKTVRIIPHGVGENFRVDKPRKEWPMWKRNIRCTYVSNADYYKHQWHVIEAISLLRREGCDINLSLVGAGSGPASGKVLEAVNQYDQNRIFVDIIPAQKHADISKYLIDTDIFIFASTCENMPNTLLEAMASGLPIACSDRGPMPEVLSSGGVYFNPEDPVSIKNAVEKLISDKKLRIEVSSFALERSKTFSWNRCARETWQYLSEISRKSASRCFN